MKILILSDSHGDQKTFKQIHQRVNPDHTIHCGDFCVDKAKLPKTNLTIVRGNCDWERVEEDAVWKVGKWKFFVTHGHRYRVKITPNTISYRASELGVQIACFGHSHYPYCEMVGDILCINPGSISSPRGFPFPTYAVLTFPAENQVKVKYYKVDGTPTNERGGLFDFPHSNGQ